MKLINYKIIRGIAKEKDPFYRYSVSTMGVGTPDSTRNRTNIIKQNRSF